MKIPRGELTHRAATAYHETGHALAALHEGRQVRGIYLSATDPDAGACLHRPEIKNPYDASLSRGDAAAAFQHTYESSCADIRIGLAGPLAEAKALGKPFPTIGGSVDLEGCIYLAERLAYFGSFMSDYADINSVNPDLLMETEKQKVRRWLGRSKIWSAVSLIADVLVQEGKLTGPVLSDLIGLAITPDWQEHLNFVLQYVED